jgi:hypothetical protein
VLEPAAGFREVAAPGRLVVRHQIGAEVVVGDPRGLGDHRLLERDAGLVLFEHAPGHRFVRGLRGHAHALAVLVELDPPRRAALIEMTHCSLPYSLLLRA